MPLEIPPTIRKDILDLIEPTEEEVRLQKTIIDRLSSALRNRGETLRQDYSFIEAQGSTGKKQTQLSGKADIDMFVGLRTSDYRQVLSLPQEKRDKKLGRVLDGLVEKWFRPVMEEASADRIQKAYSQHPYLTGILEGIDVDIVFCFDLSREQIMQDGPITAVDRTRHHTNYVAEKLDDKSREDVRIFKSFVRAGHGYGDKCAVGRMGVTGYTIEVLTIFSGNLTNALKRFLHLRDEPLDPQNRSHQELMNIKSFQDDYLIIIDPTDTGRNAAASFDSRTVKWTNFRIHQLLKNLKSENAAGIMKCIIEKPLSTEPLSDEVAPHAKAWEFLANQNVHYTVYRDKLYSLGNKIKSLLEKERTGEERFGKSLFEVYFEEPYYSIAFMVEQTSASEKYERRGPPVQLEDAVQRFKDKNENVKAHDGYVWTIEEREWTSAFKLIDREIANRLPEGLERKRESGTVSFKTLNVLRNYISKIETDFTLKQQAEIG